MINLCTFIYKAVSILHVFYFIKRVCNMYVSYFLEIDMSPCMSVIFVLLKNLIQIINLKVQIFMNLSLKYNWIFKLKTKPSCRSKPILK